MKTKYVAAQAEMRQLKKDRKDTKLQVDSSSRMKELFGPGGVLK
jgi:hypothetical protein